MTLTCEVHGIEHVQIDCPICDLEGKVDAIQRSLRVQQELTKGLQEALSETLSGLQELVKLHADFTKRMLER
jgi:hypothetical protein